MKKVGIVMGSTSDLPVVEKAIAVLQEYGVPVEVRVLSAHRCPNEAREFAASARESGFSVLIAAAGMAAHLAGKLEAARREGTEAVLKADAELRAKYH